MKSMTKLMVVAMILAAALVVAPAAARAPGVNTTIFVGEEDLDVTAFYNGTAFTRLVHYSGAVGEAIDDEIQVTDNVTHRMIDEVKKGIKTGNYYVDGNTSAYLNVRVPDVTVDVVLNESRKDSVVGKSVTRETPVAFKFANNLIAIPSKAGTGNAAMNIEVTLPGGGVVTTFGGPKDNLKNLEANGTTVYVPVSLKEATAGEYAVRAKWTKDEDFYGKGFDSNTGAFKVLTKSLAITSDKDSVVRGNSFAVTITGESNYVYYLYIKDASIASDLYPFIVDGQNGVKPAPAVILGASNVAEHKANVTTTAGGTRTVQFDTNTTTKDQVFTIRVQDPKKNTTYDDVKVKVEKGSVTITASGTGVYYIGEEVTLSGTCTDNKTKVHLFMTGPNLASENGVNLETLVPVTGTKAPAANPFNTADVEGDDTWSFKWNTGDTVKNKALDAGGYTIYAVSKPVDKSDLSSAEYATASIQLRSGFITATSSGAVIAKGDDLKLTGTAQGDPDSVWVWIFGKNKQITDKSATVEDDGSFEYELKGSETKLLAAGQYFVVIQHPMMNKVFDVKPGTKSLGNEGWIYGTPESGFASVKIDGLQASDAATALITALDSPNIDDTYVKLTFVVEEPNIWIDAIGDKTAGSKFTITGTTNLAVGDTLNIEVTSAAFKPTTKSEASGFGSVAGTTTVKQGDGANTWSFEVDGASFKPDQYIVKVECIETTTTATATFNVIEAVPTTQATPTKTAATVTTPTATATTQATPTQSPGFGALIALAGLGAVAFLVLRRD